MIKRIFIIFLISSLFSSILGQITDAACILQDFNNSVITGNITFRRIDDSKTFIRAIVNGLATGQHGIHIHQYGNLSTGCMSTGSHYNPFNQTHGSPTSQIRHVGDMGDIVTPESGPAILETEDELIKLNGETSVIGRAIVVHSVVDDFGLGGFNDSLLTGHAGVRMACCVIGIAQTPLVF